MKTTLPHLTLEENTVTFFSDKFSIITEVSPVLDIDTLTDRLPVHVSTEESDVPFTVMCFPGPGMTLSLLPLQKPEDVKAAANLELVQNLRNISRSLGADKLYAPTPIKANTEIIEPTALKLSFVLGKGVVMFRNPAVPADGTVLRQRGDAGIFSASGCGVIVATIDDHLVFAHAARDSLIDRERILTGKSSRRNESVVDSIIASFCDYGYDIFDIRTRMRVWMFYFIRPEDLADSFEHPDHGPYNRAVGPDVQNNLRVYCMYDDKKRVVMLDLPIIAVAQFIKHGISRRRINLEHCYLPEGMPHTRNGGGRSLVTIVRR